MEYSRVDSLDVTFADSFARKELKVNERRIHLNGRKAKKGVGEKRIYCGHDQAKLDMFFGLDNAPVFFLQKDDLEEYFKLIKDDLLRLSKFLKIRSSTLSSIFEEYEKKLNALDKDKLFLRFVKKYDSQNRYYIVLPRRNKATLEYHENWSYLRDVCIPRVSRLLFIKLYDEESNQTTIYIKPVYGRFSSTPSSARTGQNRFRSEVTLRYPECVVTSANEDKLLVACHIKGYADCEANEKFDPFNGFTMTPTIHKLFDLGYLTFNENGKIMFSDAFNKHDKEAFHLTNSEIVIDIDEKTQPYLKWHNEHTFINLSKSIHIK